MTTSTGLWVSVEPLWGLHAVSGYETVEQHQVCSIKVTIFINNLCWWPACSPGTEAWFESTIRKDINGGVNTRGQLKAHDPRLASIMAEIWGDGLWR
jgi:hypothetical protein